MDEELLRILACPVCKTAVTLEGDRLVCGQCGRRYPIRDEIPVMLEEEAERGPPPKRSAEGGASGKGSA
ncbi:MAG TPA: Trm112 family protein [Planctomycetota bacterium]|nr:Trm112 family protein [Planctomycetota bacterium]